MVLNHIVIEAVSYTPTVQALILPLYSDTDLLWHVKGWCGTTLFMLAGCLSWGALRIVMTPIRKPFHIQYTGSLSLWLWYELSDSFLHNMRCLSCYVFIWHIWGFLFTYRFKISIQLGNMSCICIIYTVFPFHVVRCLCPLFTFVVA